MQARHLLLWLLAASIWGSAFLFMAWSVSGFSVLETLLLRQGIGGVSLLIASALVAATNSDFARNGGEVLLNPRLLWRLLALGIINNVAPVFLVAQAQKRAAAGAVSAIVSSAPLFTCALEAALDPARKLPSSDVSWGLGLGAMGLSGFFGVTIGHGDLKVLWGIVYALCCAICYGFGSVLAKRMLGEFGLHPLWGSTVQVVCACVCDLAVCGVAAKLASSGSDLAFSWAQLVSQDNALPWVGCAYQGIFSTAVGFFLYFYLVDTIGPVALTSAWMTFPVYGYSEALIFLPHQFKDMSLLSGIVEAISSCFIVAGLYFVVVRSSGAAGQSVGKGDNNNNYGGGNPNDPRKSNRSSFSSMDGLEHDIPSPGVHYQALEAGNDADQ